MKPIFRALVTPVFLLNDRDDLQRAAQKVCRGLEYCPLSASNVDPRAALQSRMGCGTYSALGGVNLGGRMGVKGHAAPQPCRLSGVMLALIIEKFFNRCFGLVKDARRPAEAEKAGLR